MSTSFHPTETIKYDMILIFNKKNPNKTHIFCIWYDMILIFNKKKKREKEKSIFCGFCDWNFKSIVMSNSFHLIETWIWYDSYLQQNKKIKERKK